MIGASSTDLNESSQRCSEHVSVLVSSKAELLSAAAGPKSQPAHDRMLLNQLCSVVTDCLPPLKALQVQEERDRLRLDATELEERVNPRSASPPQCVLCGTCVLIIPTMLACVCTWMCTAAALATATPSLTHLCPGCVCLICRATGGQGGQAGQQSQQDRLHLRRTSAVPVSQRQADRL